MEGSSWFLEAEARPDDPSAVGSSDDWRKQLLPEARQRIVNKIMNTLKRHLPVSVPEGLNELQKIAERFEEKIYRAAINQSDYLRKISLKMLSMETKTEGAAAINPLFSNPTIGNQSLSESVNFTTQMGPADAVSVNSTIQTGPADTVAVNSITQMGHADTVDWQEEVYQKVKSMKEIYYNEICELQQTTNLKIQQLMQTDALVAIANPSDQLEKLKQFVLALERAKMFLQITKDNIPPSLNDKLPLFEKQIASFVAHYRIMKLKLEGLQFQHQPSQISTTSMQQGSAPLSINATVPATQPNIASALQPPSLDQMQGSLLQLGAIGPMQNSYQNFNGFGSLQNYTSQQRTIESQLQMQQRYLEQQSQLRSIQQKQQVPVQMNGVSQGFDSGLHQPLKPSGLFPDVSQQSYYQPLKQQLQMQQRYLEQQSQLRSIQQKQQLQMQQRYLEQQSQLRSIQQKQQVPVQMNGVSQGFDSGLHQPYFPGVFQQSYYQPLKPSGLFPIPSQQNLETAPPQSSAQVDKHAVGIPSQPTSSVIALPPFMPIASSPTEKHSGTSKSVSTESRVVTADQVAALENRVMVLKDRVASLEKSLSVILCAFLFAFFVASYFLC